MRQSIAMWQRIGRGLAGALYLGCICASASAAPAAPAAGVSANVRAGGIDSQQSEQKGSRIRRSRALGLVAAPMEQVMAVVSDYGNYRQFMPHFVASRVLSQRGGQALMYMEVSALDGMAKLWMQMQLHMLESSAPTRVIKASMLKGNLRDFAAEWHVTPFGAKYTLVAFELCADPDFHIPFADSLVSDYNEKEARKSILALRRQLSRRPSAPAR
jgi:ribosome-associated toxin RatA of RatAB toxin-antitoxin module